jgi:hypothetical protein
MTAFPHFPPSRDKRRFDLARSFRRRKTTLSRSEKHFSSIFRAREIVSARQVFRCSPEIKGASRGHATGGRTLKNVFQRGFSSFYFSPPFIFLPRAKCNNETTYRASMRSASWMIHDRHFDEFARETPVEFPFVTRRFANGIFESFASWTMKP